MKDETRKFLILGQSRSGTQLLRSLLNNHADIHCDGELLRRDLEYTRYRWRHILFRLYPDPLLKLWQNKSSTPVYGCNMMIYHLALPKPTLRRLVRSNWQVIHLLRQDLLNIALSYLIANRTGVWHREKGDTTANDTFTISPTDLERELIKRSRWRLLELQLRKEIPYQEVIYERDLLESSCWQSTCDTLFRELRIDSLPVSTTLRKTDRRRPEEIIDNFDELQTWLQNSRFRQLSVTANQD